MPLTPLDLSVFGREKTFKGNRPAVELLAEASDFDGKFVLTDLFAEQRSPGIAIRSHRTGKVELFFLESEQVSGYGSDAEVTRWTFLPLNNRIPVSRVVVYND